ncbi:MAG: YggT family protein [Chloroflexota bacterium]
MAFAQLFAGLFVLFLWVFVLARILLTWFDPGRKTRVWKLILPMTEPLLAPLRKRLPSTGAFDAAMVLWLLVLGLVWRLLL